MLRNCSSQNLLLDNSTGRSCYQCSSNLSTSSISSKRWLSFKYCWFSFLGAQHHIPHSSVHCVWCRVNLCARQVLILIVVNTCNRFRSRFCWQCCVTKRSDAAYKSMSWQKGKFSANYIFFVFPTLPVVHSIVWFTSTKRQDLLRLTYLTVQQAELLPNIVISVPACHILK